MKQNSHKRNTKTARELVEGFFNFKNKDLSNRKKIIKGFELKSYQDLLAEFYRDKAKYNKLHGMYKVLASVGIAYVITVFVSIWSKFNSNFYSIMMAKYHYTTAQLHQIYLTYGLILTIIFVLIGTVILKFSNNLAELQTKIEIMEKILDLRKKKSNRK